jgi:hypothetical protein
MATEKVISQKKEIVDALVSRIKAAESGVVVDYRGITVEDDQGRLRNQEGLFKRQRHLYRRHRAPRNSPAQGSAYRAGRGHIQQHHSGSGPRDQCGRRKTERPGYIGGGVIKEDN